MGWDIDRFPEGEVNLELVCCICTCILEDPVESPCRHVFCSQCIKTWLSNQKSCPHCRAAVHKRDLKNVVPLLRNIISKQRIYCENKENGCNEIVPLESLQSHVALCLYGFVSCANDGCNMKIMRKQMKLHSEICSRRTVLCEDGCEMFLKLGEKSTHNCIQALRAHFQEVQNEMLTRISKLEELVNMLVSKNDGNKELSRSNGVLDSYNSAPYTIPSPRDYESRPPPYTVFADGNDINSTINLTEYSLEQNDLSDSETSDFAEGEPLNQSELNDLSVRSRNRPRDNTSSGELPMSTAFQHSARSRSLERIYANRGRRLTENTRPRSRSPYLRAQSLRGRHSNIDRRPRRNRTYNREMRENNEGNDSNDDNGEEDSLVLRIGVTQTVSGSSTSSSTSSDSDTN